MGIQERRAREKAHRKQQILSAARQLLLERGLEGTTLNQIAKQAELSPAALYTYYQNKEEIIFALSEEGLELLYQQALTQINPADPPRERLRQLARAYWIFSQSQKEYFDLIAHFLTSPRPVLSARLKESIDRQGERVLSLGRGVVEEGMASGQFRAVGGREFILMFWATLNGVLQLAKLQDTILSGLDHQSLYWYAVDSLIAVAGTAPAD